ncbi:MAG TPA: hypothetical protein DEB10_14135 [Ruminococcaceae bacterium]|nr:hypothetical protein [Oscillospiraceae bacterium]
MKSEWQKVEDSVQPENQSTKMSVRNKKSSAVSAAGSSINREMKHAKQSLREAGADTAEIPQMLSATRYTTGGRRRGMHRLAAPIGLMVLVLAAIGLVSLVMAGIRAVERAQDDTPLRNELYDFLLPVMQYNPEPFSNVNESKQDALLLAAIWRITETERIQQLLDSSGISSYAMDDLGRMLIPVSEIEESYMYLFGSGVTIYHHTIGDEGKSFAVEYDESQGYYHIPSTSSSSMYVNVIDSLKKKGDRIEVRVGYVLTTKIGRDEKGELIDPTPKDAEKFQIYTVERVDTDSWKLISVANEKSSDESVKTELTYEAQDETEDAGKTSDSVSNSNQTTKSKQS